MEKNPIVFVGAGPGDPELITVKGQRALMEADLIIYAGSLVPDAVMRWARPEAQRENSAKMDLEKIVALMAGGYREGKRVLRLHSGDPSLYGAIHEQMRALEKQDIPFRVIPGVTAAFAAAAAIGMEYTLPEICQSLILTRMEGRTPVPETESLVSLAAHKASMAIYLSSALAEKVSEVLSEAYGPEAPVVVAYKVSQPGERFFLTTAEALSGIMAEEKIDRQALIIVGRVLQTPEEGFAVSKLYDKTFTHGYREGESDG